jgi:O-antigen ligase
VYRASYIILFFFTLVFAPLAFGCVEYWSVGIIELTVPAALVLLTIDLLRNRQSPYKIPGLIPLLLLLGWMGLQLVPLPPALVQLIAPKIHAAYNPLFEFSTERILIPLTVRPEATLRELLRLTTCGLFYILTVQLLADKKMLRRTVLGVTWLAIFIALETILQKLTSPDAVYWFRPAPPSTRPTGPWVYANHFAGFMEMVFPLILALFLYYKPQLHYKESLRDRITALFTMPGTNLHLLFGFGAVLAAVSIVLSASRGGIITLCIALIFFTFFTSQTIGKQRSHWAMLLTLSVFLLVTWLGWDPIIKKFDALWGDNGLNTSGRLQILFDTLPMIRDYMITGSGFGTYEVAFPAYQTFAGNRLFDHAHNDYMELLATGGIIGFTLAGCFVFSILKTTLATLKNRREQYSRLVAAGALTGLLGLLLHSFADFQIYNGANALYFFFLCGLAVSAASTRLHYRTRPSLLPKGSPRTLLLPGLMGAVFLAGALWQTSTDFLARRNFASLSTIYLSSNIPRQRLQSMHARAAQSARINPLNSLYPATMGRLSLLLNQPDRARAELLQAALLNPLSGELLQRLVLSSPTINPATTDRLLALGRKYEPFSFARLQTRIHWLTEAGDINKTPAIIRQALTANPDWVLRLRSFILLNQINRKEIETMLPDIPRAWYNMGLIMEEEGRTDDAVYYFNQTLERFSREKMEAIYFSSLYRLYLKQNKDNAALTILRRGIEQFPDNAAFHKYMGDYYRGQGITYRALEEYSHALLLNPGDAYLKKLLRKMKAKETGN